MAGVPGGVPCAYVCVSFAACPVTACPYTRDCRRPASRRVGRPAAGSCLCSTLSIALPPGSDFMAAPGPALGWEGCHRPPRNPLRTFVSAAAVLIGLLMAAVAVPAMWVDQNIVQEEGFVALTAPLGKDPAFQQRLATAAVDGLAAGAQHSRSPHRACPAGPGQRGAVADRDCPATPTPGRRPCARATASRSRTPARCRRKLTAPPRSPWTWRRLSGWWRSRSLRRPPFRWRRPARC